MSEAPIEIGDFNASLNGDQAISAQDTILKALVDGSAKQESAQAQLALGFTKVSKFLLEDEMNSVTYWTNDISTIASEIQATGSGDDGNEDRAKDQAAMQSAQAELQAITTNANATDSTNKSVGDQANSNAQNLASSLQDYANVSTKATSMLASLVSSLLPSLG